MTDITRLVDTSILVDFMRGNETAKDWMNRFPKGELACSVITAAELLAGCRRSRRSLERWLFQIITGWGSRGRGRLGS